MPGIAVGFFCPICGHNTAQVEGYREAGGLDLRCCLCQWEWTEDPYLEQPEVA
jgi:hypothetical protein